MKIYYYEDGGRRAALNSFGRDYSPAYIPVMLKNLGFSTRALEAGNTEKLADGDFLFVGGGEICDKESEKLGAALDRGCRIMAFGTKGKIFPQTVSGLSSDDPYGTVGYFFFEGCKEALPILGEAGIIKTDGALGTAVLKNGEEGCAYAKFGRGLYYFSFDLPDTLKKAADGRPTYEPKNGFSLGRIPDGCVLESDYDYSVAYADAYLRAISGVLTAAGFPRIFELPACGDGIFDMALYISGDDDAGSARNDILAAEFMYSLGMPYHINIMPTHSGFVVDKEQFDYLHKIGCETDLHYNFIDFPYTEEGFSEQHDMYVSAFGEEPTAPVNHCLIQCGTPEERYRYLVRNNALSDNSRLQNKLDPSDINAFNLSGFAFGSAFPRFVSDDAAHGNVPLPLCEVYGSYYEPRMRGDGAADREKIEKYLDDGIYYARTLQFFNHPHYISGSGEFGDPEPARRALLHALKYLDESGKKIWYCTAGKLGEWWHGRAGCQVSLCERDRFIFDNRYEKEVAVEIPSDICAVSINGVLRQTVKKTIAGIELTFVILSCGKSDVRYL